MLMQALSYDAMLTRDASMLCKHARTNTRSYAMHTKEEEEAWRGQAMAITHPSLGTKKCSWPCILCLQPLLQGEEEGQGHVILVLLGGFNPMDKAMENLA